VTDTTEVTSAPSAASAGDADLSTLRLPQLQAVASQLGISGTGRMRKSELLEAIQTRQNGGASAPASAGTAPRAARAPRRAAAPAGAPAAAPAAEAASPAAEPVTATAPAVTAAPAATDAPASTEAPAANEAPVIAEAPAVTRGREPRSARGRGAEQPQLEVAPDAAIRETARDGGDAPADTVAGDAAAPVREGRTREGRDRGGREREGRERGTRDGQSRRDGQPRDNQPRDNQPRDGQARDNQARDNQSRLDRAGAGPNDRGSNAPDDDDDDSPGGRRRRGRYRDRKRRPGRDGQPAGSGGMDAEPEVSDDDVLLPVAGILDVLESYAFLRTSGYLPGNNDVYVSLGQVKKYGLRKGDAVTGAVRQPRDGEQSNQRQKFNALVRMDTVNGATPDEARARPEFGKLVPLYPQERLRLETDASVISTRIIDLVAPIGKGQRGLIVSPPKAGKTLILQAIANAITNNNPECHLMVVLVDERPEEVTDMQRTVKGEVIASTFDRPAEDHTTVAELAIERAKRLVELGHDVVVLLDSITRLGRAYNLAAPASGRILSGGVDSSALYPPKRFFGAARNIENGGSLTILATALIETGSKMDEVIFEEFKGTGNMEVRLSRQLADKRIFPAVDVNASGTRREEILMGKDELAVIYKLRRVMGALEAQQAIELLLDRVKKSTSNAEFLMQVQKTSPGHED
jgi:transcription termination factor Rho